MSDRTPEFESSDKKGSSIAYTGTVGASWTAVPYIAGNNIQSFIIEADIENAVTNTLSVSINGGATVLAVLYPGGVVSHLIKGTLTQVHILGFAASCNYRATIDYEDNV